MSADVDPLRRFRTLADDGRPSVASLLQRRRREPSGGQPLALWLAALGGCAALAIGHFRWQADAPPAPVASGLAWEVPSDRWFPGIDAHAGGALSEARWPSPGRAFSDVEE